MSLYNLLCGKNVNTDMILAILGYREHDIGRFRDCSLDLDEKTISIYTRMGGGNREDYADEIKMLREHQDFEYDEDDDFDSTYATFYFKINEKLEEDVLKLDDLEENGVQGSIIKQVNSVMHREPTEGDLRHSRYAYQERLVRELCGHTYNSGPLATIWNGHTVVPLCDEGTEKLLKSIKENNGEFLPYLVRFWKLRVETNAYNYKFDGEHEMWRVLITDTKKWEADWEYVEHIKKVFGEKYGKEIEEIEKKMRR